MQAFMKVTSTPSGEAPEWVRRAWIGLILPLATGFSAPSSIPVRGAVSGNLLGQGSVYTVPAKVAIDILDMSQPKAANWWKNNTKWYTDFQYFLFDSQSGKIIS